jgi:hypothetical protein
LTEATGVNCALIVMKLRADTREIRGDRREIYSDGRETTGGRARVS